MMKNEVMPKTKVRHNTSQPVAVNRISRCVPTMLRQIQRIIAVSTQAQPTMLMKATRTKSCQPI
jgi:hypothetical protein